MRTISSATLETRETKTPVGDDTVVAEPITFDKMVDKIVEASIGLWEEDDSYRALVSVTHLLGINPGHRLVHSEIAIQCRGFRSKFGDKREASDTLPKPVRLKQFALSMFDKFGDATQVATA